MAAIPGRVLVLLDACHAGAAGGDRRKAVHVLTDDLIRDLVTDDYGVIVMCSSMGREYSMESDEHEQGVAHDPLPDEPAHGVVFGHKTKSVRKRFALEAEWIIPPPETQSA